MKFVHTADTHLGYEITRINQADPQGRRKRADHIFRNFLTVLDRAREIEADLFIHSGDLFNKYYIPREILDELVQPILALARAGTRILIIPGNHERSEFPFDLFHGNLFIPGLRSGSALLKWMRTRVLSKPRSSTTGLKPASRPYRCTLWSWLKSEPVDYLPKNCGRPSGINSGGLMKIGLSASI
ncbi:MAG: metallophosphoesterase [Deltaproteobacteria bacterium]|nr:metallophosphoesterase [Deltaproteobacteria bacterium]